MMVLAPPVLRRCRVCGLEAVDEYTLSLFRIDKRVPIGRATICEKCNAQHMVTYRAQPKNKQQIRRICRDCGHPHTRARGHENICYACERIRYQLKQATNIQIQAHATTNPNLIKIIYTRNPIKNHQRQPTQTTTWIPETLLPKETLR